MQEGNQLQGEIDEEIRLRMEEAQIRNKSKRYSINTGAIFIELQKQLDNYNTVFLIEEVKEALEESLIIRYNKGEGLFKKEPDEAYLNRNREDLNKAIREGHEKGTFFFPDYFIYTDLDQKEWLINYAEENNVDREDPNFDLFFSLKLSQLKLKEVSPFLLYHLETTFENNLSDYHLYLKGTLLVYSALLVEAIPIINHYLSQPSNEMVIEDSVKEGDVPKLNLQVLALHYIFQELGVNSSSIDMTELTRLTQFITNRQVSMKPQDTRIYKLLKKPLYKKDESMIKDLQEIRTYFENIKLPSIVARINKEIAGLQIA